MSSQHQPPRKSAAQPTGQGRSSSARIVPTIAVMGTSNLTSSRSGNAAHHASAARYGQLLEVSASHRPSASGSRSAPRLPSVSGLRQVHWSMLETPPSQAGQVSGPHRSSASYHVSSRSNAAGLLQVPQAQSSASRSRSASQRSSASGARSNSGGLQVPQPQQSASSRPSGSRTVTGSRSPAAEAMVLLPQASPRPSSSSARPSSSAMLPLTSSNTPAPRPSGAIEFEYTEFEYMRVRHYTGRRNN